LFHRLAVTDAICPQFKIQKAGTVNVLAFAYAKLVSADAVLLEEKAGGSCGIGL
jgi:hypothetical protein